MIIDQEIFFEGLDFEECEFEYNTGKRKCFKGIDGCFYRIDHFAQRYVIEYAENEIDAKNNCFEDTDLYDDSLPILELIKLIQLDLRKFVVE